MKAAQGSWERLGVLGVLMALLACPQAYGELVTVTFDGLLSHVEASLTGRFAIGNAMHVSLTYESTTPDQWPGDPKSGWYPAITAIDVSVAGYTASGSNGDFVVNNDRGDAPPIDDAIFAHVLSPAAAGSGTLVGDNVAGMPLWWFYLQLDDRTHTALSSDVLPTSFDTSLFDLNQLALVWRNGAYNDGIVAEEFTSTSSFHPVPLPGALLLGSLGVATVGLIGRWRRW